MSKLYSENLEGKTYTSNSEFDWNKRTQITNEVNPVDLYEGAHHMIKDGNIWQWLFGYSNVDPTIEYNIDTDGEEIFTREGEIAEASIAKYVNGIRAKDYGPVPYRENGELIIPKFNRVEQYGVLLPETDLMLHEAYRYLDTQYPDHQDFSQILTDNEIDDNISQTAAAIDYKPDLKVMNYVADNLGYGDLESADLQRAKDYERIKLKIRNLLNQSFRRKLYGALQGYKMYGADLFQHVSVYPIAEYLPYLPYQNEDRFIKQIGESKYITWFRDIFKRPCMDERQINVFNKLYKTPFRLIDWVNETYDYHQVPPPTIYGTAHPVPTSLSDIYEFRIDDSIVIPSQNINKDFKAGQKATVDGRPSNLNIIYPESSWDSYLNSEGTLIKELPESICHVLIGSIADIQYTGLKVYPGIRRTLIKAVENSANFTEYNKCFVDPTSVSFKEATTELYRLFIQEKNFYKTYNFVLSPFQKGELYVSPGKSFSFYNDYLNTIVERDEFLINPKIVYRKDKVGPRSLVQLGDIISNEVILQPEHLYISEVDAIKKGTLEFYKIISPDFYDDDVAKYITNVNEDLIPKFGLVYQRYTDKKQVVLFGKPEFELSDYDANGARKIIKTTFHITEIPRVKNFYLMRYFYGDKYLDLVNRKYDLVYSLYEKPQNGPYPFKTAYDRIKLINDRYLLREYNSDGSAIPDTEKGFKPDFDKMRVQLETDHLLPGDLTWKKLNNNGNSGTAFEYWNGFSINGTLEDTYKTNQMRRAWIKFENTVNVMPIYNPQTAKYDKDAFIELWEAIDKMALDYKDEEILTEKAETVVNEQDRSFYLDPAFVEKLSDERLEALEKIKALDKILDETMLPNQAWLIDPMPEDIYMNELASDNLKYRIDESMDGYTEFLDLFMDPIFEVYIDFKKNTKYGQGRIHEWNFGTVLTCLMVQDNQDIELLPQLYLDDLNDHIEPNYTETYIYTHNDNKDYWYITLNEFIVETQDERPNWYRKLSYTTYNWLKQFINTKQNIASIEQKEYVIKIRSIINILDDPYKITFEDEESYYRIAMLNTGDQITGLTIGNDYFIEKIDLKEHRIFVNKPFNTSGDFVLNYLSKQDIFPNELDDSNFYGYRNKLDDNDLLDPANPIQHGFYLTDEWPHPSGSYVNGPIDIKDYIPRYLDRLKTNSAYFKSFNSQVVENYIFGKNKLNYYVLPALVNNLGKLYYELHAYKTYEDDKYLIKQEMMDYFSDSLDVLSQTSDSANVGLNITSETDMSGNYQFIIGNDYTDDAIKNKFSTYYWDINTIPYSVEVGTGYLDDYFKTYQTPEDQREDNEDKSYYNYSVYDGNNVGQDRLATRDDTKKPIIVNKILIKDAIFEKVDNTIPTENGTDYSSSFTKITFAPDSLPDHAETYFITSEKFDGEYSISGVGPNWLTTDLVKIHNGTNFVPFEQVADITIYQKTQDQDDYETTYDTMIKDNIRMDKPAGVERSIYFKKGFEIKNPDHKIYNHIDKPLFEIALGEHNVALMQQFSKYIPDETKYTTVQFSIIKQIFKNLESRPDQKITIEFESYFKNNILFDIPLGMHQDAINNITILNKNYTNDLGVEHCNDSENITYDGNYTPKVNIVDGITSIEYPKKPLNDGYLHYYAIEKLTRFNNVFNESSGQTEPVFIFPKGTILYWDWLGPRAENFDKGWWQIRDFAFGGFFGSQTAFTSMLEPDNFNQEIFPIDFINTYGPGKITNDIFDNGPDSGNTTLKHRLLIKLLYQTGMFRGNYQLLIYYSERELTEIYNWIVNKLSDTDPAKLKAWTLEHYGVEYGSIDELKAGRLIDISTDPNASIKLNSQKFNLLPSTFNYYEKTGIEDPDTEEFIPEFTRHTIYWFIYTTKGQNENFRYLENAGFTDGDIIALMLIGDNFCIYNINKISKLLFLVSSKHLPALSETEYQTFLGKNGHVPNRNIIPIEKLDNIINVFKLPKTYLSKGSCNFSFRLDPQFVHEGYEWDSFVEGKRDLVPFNITEQAIYWDNDYKTYYTYNLIDQENKKFAIKLEENKYFKNVLYLIGQYQLTTEEVANRLENVSKITQIPSVLFSSDETTVLDRVLELEDINIRSPYSVNYEPMLHSSYANLKGIFKGIYTHNEDKILLYSYKDDRGPNKIVEKLKFYSEVNKIIPVRDRDGKNVEYTTVDCNYDNAKWPEGDIIQVPTISKSTVYKTITNNGSVDLFKYYKNLLILEGVVDTSLMNEISFESNPKLGDALSYLLPGDMIVKIISLSVSKYQKVKDTVLAPREPPALGPNETNNNYNAADRPPKIVTMDIEKVNFKNGWFVTATDDGWVTSHKEIRIENLPGKNLTLSERFGQNDDIYKIQSFTYFLADLKSGKTFGTKLTGLAYDEQTQHWILSYSAEVENESKYYEFTAETGDYKQIDNDQGIDINTDQIVKIIDIDSRQDDLSPLNKWDNNRYITVKAKNLAMVKAETNERITYNLKQPSEWTGGSPGSATDNDGLNGIRVDNAQSLLSKNDITIDKQISSYYDLSFKAQELSDLSNGTLSMGIRNANGSEVDSVYVYDNSLMTWRVIKSTTTLPENTNRFKPGQTEYNTNLAYFLSDFKNRQQTYFKTYVVLYDFLDETAKGENLVPIPPYAPGDIPVPYLNGEPLFTKESYVYSPCIGGDQTYPLLYRIDDSPGKYESDSIKDLGGAKITSKSGKKGDVWQKTNGEYVTPKEVDPKDRHYVLYGDFNMPLDTSLPPSRVPYSSGDLPYTPITSPIYNNQIQISNVQNELGKIGLGSLLTYSQISSYLSQNPKPNQYLDRSPFVSINDAANLWEKEDVDKERDQRYFVAKVNFNPDAEKMMCPLDTRFGIKDEFGKPVTVDNTYYNKYGWHLELDVQADGVTLNTDTHTVAQLSSFDTIPTKKVNADYITFQSARFKLVANTDFATTVGREAWMADMTWTKVCKSQGEKYALTQGQNQGAGNMASSWLTKIPNRTGAMYTPNGDNKTIKGTGDTSSTEATVNFSSNMIIYDTYQECVEIPMYVFFAGVPKSPLSADNPNGILTAEDAKHYIGEKWYINEKMVHPAFTSNFGTLRFWPSFEVPLSHVSTYNNSENFIRDYYIYTNDYADYCQRYLSYINSLDFANYIENLQNNWGYAGGQFYGVEYKNNTNKSNWTYLDMTPNYYHPTDPKSAGFVRTIPVLATVPQSLMKLPPPETTNNMQIAAVRLAKGVNKFRIRIDTKLNGKFNIIDAKVETPLFLNEGINIFAKYQEGTYNPFKTSDYMEYLRKKMTSSKFVVSNRKNMQVRLYGDKLFFYGPVKTHYLETVGGKLIEIEGPLSEAYHWKRAQLPGRRQIEQKLFQGMSIAEAYAYVKSLYDNTLATVIGIISQLNSGNEAQTVNNWTQTGQMSVNDKRAMYETYRKWLVAHDIIKFETEDLIPPYLYIDNITFTITENGKIPCFYDQLINIPKVEYYATEVEDRENGKENKIVLKRNNYLLYLMDYATAILGNTRYENFFDFYMDNSQTSEKTKFGNPYSGIVKEVYLTDTHFIVLTKYDDVLSLPIDKMYDRIDIESIDNWSVTNIDPQYVIETESPGNYVTKTLQIMDREPGDPLVKKSKSYTFNQWANQLPMKGFTLNARFIDGKNIIFAGYVQANEAIFNQVKIQTTYSIFNELYSNDGWKYFEQKNGIANGTIMDKDGKSLNKKYPVIFYSSDSGRSFTKAILPNKNFIPDIKSYTDTIKNADGSTTLHHSFTHIECFSIHKHGTEYHIWMSNTEKSINDMNNKLLQELYKERYDWAPLGYTSISSENNTLKYLENIDIEWDDDEIKLARCKNATIIDNVIINTSKDDMVLQIPKQIEGNNIRIAEVNNNNIKILPQEISEEELLRVLVAINPSKLLTDQTRYLDLNSEYIDSNGKFLVPEVIEVSNTVQANRMYSERECMVQEQRDVKPLESIPAVAEDANRSIYEYYDPFKDHNGEDYYQYMEATNSLGENIYLCDSEQNYLIKINPSSSLNYYRLWNLIDLGVSPTQLVKAPKLLPDINVTIKDVETTEFLNNQMKHYLKINYFNLIKDDPRIWIKSQYMINFLMFLQGYRLLENGRWHHHDFRPIGTTDNTKLTVDRRENKCQFYIWPKNANGTPMANPPKYYKLSNNSSDDVNSPTDYGRAVLFIEKIDGNFGSTFNPELEKDRIGYYELAGKGDVQENGPNDFKNYYVYDKKNNLIMCKDESRLETSIYMPHRFKAGAQEFPNEPFVVRDEALQSPLEAFPITGTFLEPRGYSGTNVNDSWMDNNPYETDYITWEDKLAKNVNDEDIYLIDSKGERLFSNHGLFRQEPWESTIIKYKELVDEGLNTVLAYKNYPNNPCEYNLYKFLPNRYNIYTPKDEIYFNCHYFTKGQATNPKAEDVVTDQNGHYVQDPITGDNMQASPLPNQPSYFEPYEFSDYPGKKVSLLMSPVVILSNGVEQIPDVRWVIKFFDGEGNELENFIYRDKKIFYVYEDKGVNWDDWKYIPDRLMDPNNPEYPINQINLHNLENRVPQILGGVLILSITDTFGQTVKKELKVKPSDQFEIFKIIEMNHIEFGNSQILFNRENDLINNNLVTIICDSTTVENGQSIESSDQQLFIMTKNILFDRTLIINGKRLPFKVMFLVNGLPIISTLSIDTEVLIEPDLRQINDINIYTNRNWANTINQIGYLTENVRGPEGVQVRVLAKDQDITDRFRFNLLTIDDEVDPDIKHYFVEGKDDIMLTLKSQEIVITNNVPDILLDDYITKFVYTISEEFEFNYPRGQIIVENLHGNMLLKTPVYDTYKSLLDNEMQIIKYKVPRIIQTYNGTEFNKIIDISKDLSTVKLANPINYRKFADGKLHNIKIKLLPVNSIISPISKMNDPSYVQEVTYTEGGFFGYDRVWFNPEGYYQPPVIMNNTMYREESIPYYYNKPWKNKDNVQIYECDDKGRYIRNGIDQDGIVHHVLGSKIGNLSADIYGSIDKRFAPREPIYKSTGDWYYYDFFVKGEESNPFWQWVEIEEIYDSSSNLWSQNANILSPHKDHNHIIKVLTGEDDKYSFIIKNIDYYEDAGKIISNPEIDFINYKDGLVNFTLGYPAALYKKQKYIIKYGMKYLNTFYPGEINRQVWTGYSKLDHLAQMSFAINTTQNFANITDKDSSKVQITEMGLFNKDHELVAYMSHPIVEYKSDLQHLSYTLLIRSKNIQQMNHVHE